MGFGVNDFTPADSTNIRNPIIAVDSIALDSLGYSYMDKFIGGRTPVITDIPVVNDSITLQLLGNGKEQAFADGDVFIKREPIDKSVLYNEKSATSQLQEFRDDSNNIIYTESATNIVSNTGTTTKMMRRAIQDADTTYITSFSVFSNPTLPDTKTVRLSKYVNFWLNEEHKEYDPNFMTTFNKKLDSLAKKANNQ